ncbi:trypsin-like peptidase domain-containing protein [Actinomyces sp. 186855]|nr:trypsin-like peptidase domain-containing protein [Actinomyces sp. AC-20-1]MCL3789167.1 trypsin-like peptidase domain-containing protein [Actinomyces sp. 187325]MCL3791950.1 trypsin-like peptidase domain-containing protein [Actinomyces sp. 186855]MCL3794567.1 trypsin-like peptidase domain-containing protein [Actinomyces sp. 217892]
MNDEWSTGRDATGVGGAGSPGPVGSADAATGSEAAAGASATPGAGSPGTVPSPYAAKAASSAWPAQAPTGSYTSVPQAPAGYSFERAPGSSSAASAPDPFAARPAWAAPQPGAPSGAAGPAAPDAAGARASRARRRRGPGWGGVVATSLVTAMLACGGTVATLHYLDGEPAPTASVSAAAQHTGGTTQLVAQTGTSPDWEAVTQAVANSVVSITVSTSSGTSVGSGVVYDSAGHILTNHHVVAGATRIQATLADGRIYEAELTGTDAATDLAVIQLVNGPSDLTVARFGDSDAVVTGQDVMAIGNPLGLSSTATTGIVSALNRPVVTTQEQDEGSSPAPGGGFEPGTPSRTAASQVVTNAIQIDAAINPGNSGGPLFDASGTVIGITSSIASTGSSDSGSIGIGFAIPSNLAAKVADQLIESGTATHAYLGVSITNGGAEAEDATYAGALVGSVEAGSPADEAGLEEGDVITAINGKATSQSAALTGFVRQYSAGDVVTLTVVRDGRTLELTATLAERKDS